jgi:hypothetical protein
MAEFGHWYWVSLNQSGRPKKESHSGSQNKVSAPETFLDRARGLDVYSEAICGPSIDQQLASPIRPVIVKERT